MNIWLLIVLVAASALTTAGCLYFVGLALGWRNQMLGFRVQYDQLLTQAMQLKADKAHLEVELDFVKTSVNGFLSKQIQAVLSEAQFAGLIQWLEARREFETVETPPDKKKVQ